MIEKTLDQWYSVIKSDCCSGLEEILSDDVIFYSPIVHSPQEGKPVTMLYLMAASKVLNNSTFSYLRTVVDEPHAVLEFRVVLDGIIINGVDMITIADDGKIIEFKVMLRPLKAINLIHKMMGSMLEAMR